MPGTPIIGLTGGIGAGKSTVARVFSDSGVAIVDADRLAREVVAPGSDVMAAITESFGAGVVHEDGNLNRSALAALVFQDTSALSKLNSITHPAILALAQERIALLVAQGARWLVYEAALIVGSQMAPALEALVVVHASEDARVERVVHRDQLSIDEVQARMANQLPPQALLDVADYVVSNEGSLEDLQKDAHRVLDVLIQRLGPPQEEDG